MKLIDADKLKKQIVDEFGYREAGILEMIDYQPVINFDVEPMTNEKWFCGLSMKEKAKWFCDHITCSDGCRFYGKCFNEHMGRELWEEWLKQPHNEVAE